MPGLLGTKLNQWLMARTGSNSCSLGPSSFIIRLLDRVLSDISVLLLDLTNFMCVNPRSQAVLVAGIVRTRSNRLSMLGYSCWNLLFTCSHVSTVSFFEKLKETCYMKYMLGYNSWFWCIVYIHIKLFNCTYTSKTLACSNGHSVFTRSTSFT